MLIVIYIILLVLGFKATWKLVANVILAGSSEILLPIILFIVAILIIGPFMGIYSLIKYIILYFSYNRSNAKDKSV